MPYELSRANKPFSSNWEFTLTIVVGYKSKAGIEFSNKYYFFHKISTDLKPDSYLFYQHKWSTKKEPVCVFLHFCWIIIGSSATFLWEFAAERKKKVDFKKSQMSNGMLRWKMKTKRNSNHNGCEQQI